MSELNLGELEEAVRKLRLHDPVDKPGWIAQGSEIVDKLGYRACACASQYTARDLAIMYNAIPALIERVREAEASEQRLQQRIDDYIVALGQAEHERNLLVKRRRSDGDTG